MSAVFRSFIEGEWVDGNLAPVSNPSDLDDVVGYSSHVGVAEAEAAVEAAVDAQEDWREFPNADRIALLERIGSIILDSREELARQLSREEGKLLAEAQGEVMRAGQTFRYFAGQLLEPRGDHYASIRSGVEAEVRHRPLGAVGVITPWNYPIAIPAWKIAPALAFGNTIVFKPAELVPASAAALAGIIGQAGAPPGVFNLVLGSGQDVGQALLESTRLDGISFTGSVKTGRQVAMRCIEHGNKRFQLEMGGKNALVVMDDADLEIALRCAVDGAFFSTGQRCTASSRLLVHDAIYDEFVDALVKATESLRVGHALDPASQVGPVVDDRQLAVDLDYIEIGRSEGAEVLAGGVIDESAGHGHYLRPTVLAGATNQMRIAREEIFGPVTTVIRVSDFDEAVAVSNDTPFGLAAGIVTTSLRHATEFKRKAHAGLVSVNLATAGSELHLPFGGVKGSNHGPRESGKYARQFYTQPVSCYTAW